MGAAYFIVLDKPEIDAFCNGKALAREGRRLSRIAKSSGLRTLDDFVSFSDEDMASAAEDFGVEGDIAPANIQWFAADEGLTWITTMRDHIRGNPNALKNIQGVLLDLAEYEQILQLAKDAQARWHLSVDY